MRYRSGTFAVLLACGSAFAQTLAKPESRDMELVGFHDLQGRSAYQPLVHRQGDRWIAYIGHHGGHSRNPLSDAEEDRKSTRLNSSHSQISYAVFCLKKKKTLTSG